ncbi:MAG: TIGR01906 family membrane protein [Lachnospiraceae bacterium]|nr:TIGR01906 family membrane protein [Lachnospiraceae bacterium]
MKAVKTLISIILTLLGFFILFDFCVYAVIFSKSYLNKKYREYNVAADLSMTDEDLEAVTAKLANYVKGREESIDIEVSVRGEVSDFYNETDISHMKDVRGIIIRLRDFLVLSSFAALLSAVLLIIGKAKEEFRNGVLIADALIVLLAGAVVIAANTNLDWLIVFAHGIFFNNTDWLLDPAYDNLIFLCPEQLFIDAGKICGFIWIGYLILITAFAIIQKRSLRPRSSRR